MGHPWVVDSDEAQMWRIFAGVVDMHSWVVDISASLGLGVQ
jgi:hypothetical protein